MNDEEKRAIRWLWENAPSKCGIEFENNCTEHDTCQQRMKVRKAFPFLEGVN